MGGMRRLLVGVVLVCGMSALVALPAGAVPPLPSLSPETFSGTCTFQMEELPPDLGFSFQGGGICSGVFDGQLIVSYPSLITAHAKGLGTLQSPIVLTGPGALFIGVPCGGGGFCLTPVAFNVVQATPYLFAVIGAEGGVGAGVASGGTDSNGTATFVAVGLTSQGVHVGI